MKKIFFGLLLALSFSYAEINEYLSDVYFANGINMDEDDAKDALDEINLIFESTYMDSFKYVKRWRVSENHTQGIGIDLYESMLQKIDEDWRIKYALDLSGILKFTYGGIAKMVVKKVAKEAIEEFAEKQAAKIARKIFVRYRPGDGTLDGYTQAAVELLFPRSHVVVQRGNEEKKHCIGEDAV